MLLLLPLLTLTFKIFLIASFRKLFFKSQMIIIHSPEFMNMPHSFIPKYDCISYV